MNSPSFRKFLFPIIYAGYFMVLGVMTLDHYGVGWDNPIHYKNGEYTVEYVLGISDKIFTIGIMRAPLADMLSYLSYWLFHLTLEWLPAISAYHLPLVIFGGLTVGTLTYFGQSINRLTGIVGGGLLLIHPLYFGWAHLSMKDIPVSLFFLLTIITGYWWIERKQDRWFYWACVWFGMGFAVKATILLVLPILAIYQLVRFKQKPLPSPAKLGKLFAFGVGIFWGVMILAWPTSWNHPLLPFHLLEFLATDLGGPGGVLYQGKYYFFGNESLPWHYVPWMLTIKTPLVLLAGIALTPLGYHWNESLSESRFNRFLVLSVIVIVFSIMIGMLHSSSQYDVDRHYIFLYPFLALMAGLGWVDFLKRYPSIVTPLVLIGVVYCVVRVVSLHPNEIVFYNDLVGRETGVAKEYELDYYGNAYRQGARWVNENLPKNATIFIPKQGNLVSYFLRDDLGYQEYSKKGAGWAMILYRKGINPFSEHPPDVIIPSKDLPLLYIYKLNPRTGKPR